MAMRAAPRAVCKVSSRATSGCRPRRSAAAIITSITRKKYAGPLPETAVTASRAASSATQRVAPAAPRIRSATWRWAWSTPGSAYRPVMPVRTSAGVLGMHRTRGAPPPSQRLSAASGIPAAIESTSGRWASAGARPRATSAMTCGLTASTRISAAAAARALSSEVWMPNSAASRWRASPEGSQAVIRAAG